MPCRPIGIDELLDGVVPSIFAEFEMKKITALVLALIGTTLVGCAATGANYANRTPEEVADATTLVGRSLQQAMYFIGPEIRSKSGSDLYDYHLRAEADRHGFVVGHQLLAKITYRAASARRYIRASVKGEESRGLRAHELVKSGCDEGICTFEETVAVLIKDPVLRESVEEGIIIKVFSSTNQVTQLPISNFYLTGYLYAINTK